MYWLRARTVVDTVNITLFREKFCDKEEILEEVENAARRGDQRQVDVVPTRDTFRQATQNTVCFFY